MPTTEPSDPYKLLSQSIKRLSTPLEQLLNTHDEFVLQNLSIINNLKTVPSFATAIENGVNKEQQLDRTR
ncbi:hypothetical protein G9P44_001869 [Scheffersomyces stipitis]|nr:hypothetical protein G9P44_001869 [Scheffersomyces stipitis]